MAISLNSLFNAGYVNNFGYEYPQYNIKTEAQTAGEELSTYFSRLKSPYNPAGNNPYINFVANTQATEEAADTIPETDNNDYDVLNDTYTNLPGKHELNDFVEGYKQILVNDDNGREIEKTVSNANGDFIYRSESKYYETGNDLIEEKSIYDESGNNTGSIIYYSSSDKTGLNTYRIEYRDSSGNVLCVFNTDTGKWIDKHGQEIKIKDVGYITRQIYPNNQLMTEYEENAEKITPIVDNKVNEILCSQEPKQEEIPKDKEDDKQDISTEKDNPDENIPEKENS